MPSEHGKLIQGQVRILELPGDWDTDARLREWWQYLPRSQKERFVVHEAENTLTNAGRTAILNFLGGSSVTFFQQFAVGNGTISGVSSLDTTLSGEFARGALVAFNVSGNVCDCALIFGTASANGLWTNAGIWGNGASGTLGSGTLYTHTLFSYSKSSSVSVQIDYLFTLLFS